MSDSEWDKLMYRLKPYLNENHIQFGLYQDIKAVGDGREQKLKTISEKILIWCNDCLKPDYVCPSCIYGDIKKILGLNPNHRELLGVEE